MSIYSDHQFVPRIKLKQKERKLFECEIYLHYKTLAAYRRLFLPLSGVFSGETTLRRFCKSPKKKRGKVAHRRFYKRRRIPTNAETRDAENNIIFRHTGVSRNAGMSIILIIDIPAF